VADRIALGPPPADLTGFPSRLLRAGSTVYRSHSIAHDAWCFASAPNTGGGRFDLPPPFGTCYVAATMQAALRERLRATIPSSGNVPPQLAQTFAVSSFAVPRDYRCADIDSARAVRFGVTRELATMTPSHYPLARLWAVGFAEAGFDGIRYGARFTTGRPNAWALFGPAGAHQQPEPAVKHRTPGPDACHRCGLSTCPIADLMSLSVSDH